MVTSLGSMQGHVYQLPQEEHTQEHLPEGEPVQVTAHFHVEDALQEALLVTEPTEHVTFETLPEPEIPVQDDLPVRNRF